MNRETHWIGKKVKLGRSSIGVCSETDNKLDGIRIVCKILVPEGTVHPNYGVVNGKVMETHIPLSYEAAEGLYWLLKDWRENK